MREYEEIQENPTAISGAFAAKRPGAKKTKSTGWASGPPLGRQPNRLHPNAKRPGGSDAWV